MEQTKRLVVMEQTSTAGGQKCVMKLRTRAKFVKRTIT